MLYYVPLEHLEERYTISMDQMLQKAFKEAGIKYKTIQGESLSTHIKSGAFLDFSDTIHFKSSQIQKISQLFFENKIKNNDIFFFSDLWFPGIDSLPYMARLSKIKIQIVGYQYAGSWTPSDFVALFLKDYCQYLEHGWLQFIDQMYLGSKFQREELIRNLLKTNTPDHSKISEKLIVTNYPYDYEYVRSFYNPSLKQDIVIFPHRFHWEKGAQEFLDMALNVSKQMPDSKFVITSGRKSKLPLADKKGILNKYKAAKKILGERLIYKSGLSKPEYYQELNKAKVVWSGALQENFGYSVTEACTLGVTPVLPNRVVYPEFYPSKYLYNTHAESCQIVIKYLKKPSPIKQSTLKHTNGLEKTIQQLQKLASSQS